MLLVQFSSIEQHQQSHKADTQHYHNEMGEGDTSTAARLLDFGDEVGASDVNEAASGDGEHDQGKCLNVRPYGESNECP